MMYVLRGIVLMALFLAAAVGLYSFSNTQRSVAPSFNEDLTEKLQGQIQVVKPTLASQNTILSGVPAYGRLEFLLPKDTEIKGGDVQIAFRSEVAAEVNATMRILVNGVRRTETVLNVGTAELVMRFALLPEDFAQTSLQISFSLAGRASSNVCGRDEAATVVQILPQTELDLVMATSEMSLKDRYRVAGGVAHMQWEASEGVAKLLAASNLRRYGFNVGFEGTSHFSLVEALSLPRVGRDILAEAPQWPLPVPAAFGSARSFDVRSTWRHNFRLEDLPDGRYPSALVYGLNLGPMLLEQGVSDEWLVWVTLNGRLLETYKAQEGITRRQLLLPVEAFDQDNLIEVNAGRPYGVGGVCNQGPTLVGELLPDAQLLPGILQPSPTAEIATLLGAQPVLSNAGLDVLEVPSITSAVSLLAQLPTPVLSSAQYASAFVKVIRSDEVAFAAQGDWIVFFEGRALRALPRDEAGSTIDVATQAVVLQVTPMETL